MIHSFESNDFEDLPDRILSIDLIEPNVYKKLLKSYLKSSCRHLFGVANADRTQIDHDIDAFVENGTFNQHLIDGEIYATADDLLQEMKAKESILAAVNIAKSMYTTLGTPGWIQMKAQNAQMLNVNIQGKLTKQLVLEAFRLNNGVLGTPQERWVQRYVNELGEGEADREKLKQFVWAISGRSSISSGQFFTINPQAGNVNLPAFHTCAQQIDIPTYPNYDTFKRKLEDSIAYVVATGNFGLA